ncbi:MAG: hypothetical protein GY778_16960 [bacterium]|nr:hypothetical protein [bacterium]
MRTQRGGVNGSGRVNATDENLYRTLYGGPLDQSNFFYDVSGPADVPDGVISRTDYYKVKGWINHFVDECECP